MSTGVRGRGWWGEGRDTHNSIHFRTKIKNREEGVRYVWDKGSHREASSTGTKVWWRKGRCGLKFISEAQPLRNIVYFFWYFMGICSSGRVLPFTGHWQLHDYPRFFLCLVLPHKFRANVNSQLRKLPFLSMALIFPVISDCTSKCFYLWSYLILQVLLLVIFYVWPKVIFQ